MLQISDRTLVAIVTDRFSVILVSAVFVYFNTLRIAMKLKFVKTILDLYIRPHCERSIVSSHLKQHTNLHGYMI